MRKGRLRRLIAVLVVLAGGLTASALRSGPASAVACGTAQSTCTATGTLTVTAGLLTLTSPATLTWSATLNGTVQSIVDVLPTSDEQYTVSDLTGSGAGWHVTTSATTFTNVTNGTHTLPDTGTFVTTGSNTSITATTAPTVTCTGTCTAATNSTVFPVAITTAASAPTPVRIYNAASATGLGVMVIGGSAATDPVGWWVNVPPTAYAGAYTSTVTMAIVTAP